MSTFHSLTVSELAQQTTDCRTIAFSIPAELRDDFAYFPGQYLTVRKPGKEDLRRCYSICSTPDDEHLLIGVKRVPGGAISPYLVDELCIGDELEVGTPEGSFLLAPNPLRNKEYVFIAGGSGVTPIKAMISHLSREEPFSRVTLLYGNRDEESIIFREYFDRLAEANKRFTVVHCLQSPSADWTGATGLLTYEKCYALIGEAVRARYAEAEYYVCGPGPMMDNAKRALLSLEVPESQIHIEYFTLALEDKGAATRKRRSVRLLTASGAETVVVQPAESILDAALAADVSLPYSCRMGVCSSCKQKVTRGKVSMVAQAGLTDAEIAAGYVLTCQAHPESNDVEIDCRAKRTINHRRRFNRRVALAAGILLGAILLGGMTFPAQKDLLALGPMNTGHEKLACEDCHSPARGTAWQQLNANFNHLVGQRAEAVTFGSDDVDNKKCQSCHERKDDRHPVHRFREPRFREARLAIGATECESCHREHSGRRLTTANLTFCQNCHQDTELSHDPLDVPHTELIKNDLWNTCLQCHDFHGNHVMHTPERMRDTIPLSRLKAYAAGGADPFGEEKIYDAEDIAAAIRKLKPQTNKK